MKTNKLNLVIIGLAGILSNPASAQKFYQCMPIANCQKGEYRKDGTCHKCPENGACRNNELALECPAGTWLYRTCENGWIEEENSMCPTGKHPADKSTASHCQQCPTGYYCPGDGDLYLCPALSVADAGSSECTPIPVKVTLKGESTEVDFFYGFKHSITITANGKSENVAGGGCGVGITAFNTDCVMLRPIATDPYTDRTYNNASTIEVCLSDPTPKDKGVYTSATFYTSTPPTFFK